MLAWLVTRLDDDRLQLLSLTGPFSSVTCPDFLLTRHLFGTCVKLNPINTCNSQFRKEKLEKNLHNLQRDGLIADNVDKFLYRRNVTMSLYVLVSILVENQQRTFDIQRFVL